MDITLDEYIHQLYKASEAKIFYFSDSVDNETKKYYEKVGYDLNEFDYHSTEPFLYEGLIYPALTFIMGNDEFVESSRFVYLKDCMWMAQALPSMSSDETPIIIISQKFLSLCHFYVQTYYFEGLNHKEILQRIVRCVYPTKPDDLVLPILSAKLTEEQNIYSLYDSFAMILYTVLHEYAHVYLGHLTDTSKVEMFQGSNKTYDVNTSSIEREHQADLLASQWLLKLRNEYTSDDPEDMLLGTIKHFESFPSVFVIIGLHERSKRLNPKTHPSVNDRVEWIKGQLNNDPSNEAKDLVERLAKVQNYLKEITWKESEDMKISAIITAQSFNTEDADALNGELKNYEIEVGVPKKATLMFPVDNDIITILIFAGSGFIASGGNLELLRDKIKKLIEAAWISLFKSISRPTPMSVSFQGNEKTVTVTGLTDKEQQNKMIDAIVKAITMG
ncbi:MAG: hypothetical protein FWG87_04200 [Defluviitaleaceae bacterium]|nr:hypothetical protein [Defluviitaleaceae bacterium]